MNRTSTRCGSCGSIILSNDPDTMSKEVANKFRYINTYLPYEWLVETDYLNAPHPLCSDCFVGWIHNLLYIGTGDDEHGN